MKTIKVLGTGCSNCNATEKLIEKVANEENITVNIVKVDDIQKIMEYDVMSTPAIVIDEKVIIKGRVPSVDEVKEFIGADDNCCDDSDSSCGETTENNSGSCCGS